MRHVVATVLILVACGKGGDQKGATGSSAKAGASAPSAGPPAPEAVGVAGSLTLGGDVTGTFTHLADLNLTCSSLPDLPQATFDVSLGDGKGAFMALQGIANKEKHTLQFSHLEIGSAPITEGFTLTGDAKNHVNLMVDTSATGRGKTITIKGQLAFTCPP